MENFELRDLCRREFQKLRDLAEAALAQCTDEEFLRAASTGDNSLALLVKHVAGNQRSRWTRFLDRDGEKPDRDRDSEFELREGDDRSTLMARWAEGWDLLLGTLDRLSETDFDREVRIRGEAHSVAEAIHRQLTHYAYHVGQIVFLAKGWRKDAWQSLSIAKGKSQAFNAAPDGYLEPENEH